MTWPGGVTWTVADLEFDLAHLHRIAVFEPPIGGEGPGAAQAVTLGRGFDQVDPVLVGGVRSLDRGAGALGHLGDPAGVIGVAVGDPDLLDGHALVAGDAQQLVDLAAGIDDRGLHRLGAPDQGAVLLQRRDRSHEGADRKGRVRRVHLLPMIVFHLGK